MFPTYIGVESKVYMVYKVQQVAWDKTIRMIAARYKLMVGDGSYLCWVQMVARFTGRERAEVLSDTTNRINSQLLTS